MEKIKPKPPIMLVVWKYSELGVFGFLAHLLMSNDKLWESFWLLSAPKMFGIVLLVLLAVLVVVVGVVISSEWMKIKLWPTYFECLERYETDV